MVFQMWKKPQSDSKVFGLSSWQTELHFIEVGMSARGEVTGSALDMLNLRCLLLTNVEM